MKITQKDLKIIKDALEVYISSHEYEDILKEVESVENKIKKMEEDG